MKSILLSTLCISCLLSSAVAQDTDSIAASFKETSAATRKNKAIWGTDLYNNILLIDPVTRQVYANRPDSAGLLQKSGSVYTGTWPVSQNIANTSVEWSGYHWAMVQLPLPKRTGDRLNLLTHELFHRAQPGLGFNTRDALNNHLDTRDGRIYLQLELAALGKALEATSPAIRKKHLTDAFTFRQYRYSLFPGAEKTENMLELHEGLAEYTGVMMSGRTKAETLQSIAFQKQRFLGAGTFIRSFAYHTVPVYGYLLAQTNPSWTRDIKDTTSLEAYFRKAWQLTIPANLGAAVTERAPAYDGPAIIAAETVREEKRLAVVAGYVKTLVTDPHTEIRFEKMNISFNPSNMLPLEKYGTVYITLRITDKWGVLTAQEGALVGAGWEKVSVTLPERINGNTITGRGWELQLNEGYQLVKDDAGQYKLQRK
ncbi:hypothetical protein ECE50_008150 [Chitinophaga sp. Mgbs1]|uniref:Uncharacterized protein n=1 Tax=Chitinophaga solisilvae TaxID=1233460 RepID=A0A9Q5GVM0_9BACT|nr:hypothetical protein [Chitinophaga solisilvae]